MKKKIAISFAIILFVSLISTNITFAYKISSNNIVKNNQDAFDMIIISPEQFRNSLDNFITHKKNHEIETTFISLEDIYNGVYFDAQGRDNPEKIKYFIKNSIEEWNIKYVLFIGGSKQVPVRLCYNDDEYSNYPEPKFVSELYYADIYDSQGGFSSWDSDNDGIFGEWDGDVAEDKNIDLRPDVCIGRLACQNIEEVKTVVKKIINYENTPANPSWFKKMVVAGGDTYRKIDGLEGEINNQIALDIMSDFTAVKLCASTGTLDKYGFNLLREINKGCGFLYLSGHGSTSIWATYTPDNEKVGNFETYKIKFLSNKQKLPICIVGGCHNSQFSVGIKKAMIILKLSLFEKNLPINGCWSWELTKKADGGSIATIGSTGLSWISAEYNGAGVDWLNIQFFREYKDNVKNIGEIWKNTVTKYVDENPINWNTPSGGNYSIDAKSAQEWMLLGDPSLIIGGYEA